VFAAASASLPLCQPDTGDAYPGLFEKEPRSGTATKRGLSTSSPRRRYRCRFEVCSLRKTAHQISGQLSYADPRSGGLDAALRHRCRLTCRSRPCA
jgi:hypothetical protein